jgi:hypothetical protein
MFARSLYTLSILIASAAASDFTTPQRLLSKSKESAYNGLYFGSYHTGAGLADATIAPGLSYALPGAFLNATADVAIDQYYLDFNLTIATDKPGGTYYAAQVQFTETYDTMYKLTVSIAELPTPGFSFDKDGKLAWRGSTDFAACTCVHPEVRLLSLIANVSRVNI